MHSQPFNLPPDFDSQVRLFPLSNQVLLPGNVLPLRIFESRYKEMLQNALRSDRLIAMATLVPGFEHDYYSRPPVEPYICIGRIVFHKPSDQGTHILMLLGLQRARIDHEIEPVKSFRRAKVEIIGNVDAEGEAAHDRLAKQLTDQISQVLPEAPALLEKFTDGDRSLALLTDIAAFHLPLETDVKLQLLAEANSVLRAKLLMTHLPPIEAAEDGQSWYFDRFSDN